MRSRVATACLFLCMVALAWYHNLHTTVVDSFRPCHHAGQHGPSVFRGLDLSAQAESSPPRRPLCPRPSLPVSPPVPANPTTAAPPSASSPSPSSFALRLGSLCVTPGTSCAKEDATSSAACAVVLAPCHHTYAGDADKSASPQRRHHAASALAQRWHFDGNQKTNQRLVNEKYATLCLTSRASDRLHKGATHTFQLATCTPIVGAPAGEKDPQNMVWGGGFDTLPGGGGTLRTSGACVTAVWNRGGAGGGTQGKSWQHVMGHHGETYSHAGPTVLVGQACPKATGGYQTFMGGDMKRLQLFHRDNGNPSAADSASSFSTTVVIGANTYRHASVQVQRIQLALPGVRVAVLHDGPWDQWDRARHMACDALLKNDDTMAQRIVADMGKGAPGRHWTDGPGRGGSVAYGFRNVVACLEKMWPGEAQESNSARRAVVASTVSIVHLDPGPISMYNFVFKFDGECKGGSKGEEVTGYDGGKDDPNPGHDEESYVRACAAKCHVVANKYPGFIVRIEPKGSKEASWKPGRCFCEVEASDTCIKTRPEGRFKRYDFSELDAAARDARSGRSSGGGTESGSNGGGARVRGGNAATRVLSTAATAVGLNENDRTATARGNGPTSPSSCAAHRLWRSERVLQTITTRYMLALPPTAVLGWDADMQALRFPLLRRRGERYGGAGIVAVGGTVKDSDGVLSLPCKVRTAKRAAVQKRATNNPEQLQPITEKGGYSWAHGHKDTTLLHGEVFACDAVGGPFMVRTLHGAVAVTAVLERLNIDAAATTLHAHEMAEAHTCGDRPICGAGEGATATVSHMAFYGDPASVFTVGRNTKTSAKKTSALKSKPPPPSLFPSACASADKHGCGCDWAKNAAAACAPHVNDGSPCWAACCCPFQSKGEAGGETAAAAAGGDAAAAAAAADADSGDGVEPYSAALVPMFITRDTMYDPVKVRWVGLEETCNL